MPIYTAPQTTLYAELFARAIERMGSVAASMWMFTGNAKLDGLSPLQAIKAGRGSEVEALIFRPMEPN